MLLENHKVINVVMHIIESSNFLEQYSITIELQKKDIEQSQTYLLVDR